MKEELVLKIEDYEGPIHLLLEMFKSNKLEITLLNIDVILDQYLSYIDECKDNDILLAANYLDLAAEIILYKSKKILKLDEEVEQEEEVLDKEDLINKILEYKSYKEASKDMGVLTNKRQLYLSKEEENLDTYIDEELKPISFKKFYDTVAKLYLDIKKNSKEEKVIIKKDLNISDYVDELSNLDKIDMEELFTQLPKREKVIYFLAILIILKKEEFKMYETNGNIVIVKSEV